MCNSNYWFLLDHAAKELEASAGRPGADRAPRRQTLPAGRAGAPRRARGSQVRLEVPGFADQELSSSNLCS